MQRIEKTIAEFMHRHAVPRLHPEDTVARAVELMRKPGLDCVLVVDDGALVGVFTGRDFLYRVARHGHNPATMTLAEVMTRRPETLGPHDCISYAINRMAVQGYRNVPIVNDDGALVALLSVRDVVDHLAEVFDDVESSPVRNDLGDRWVDLGGG